MKNTTGFSVWKLLVTYSEQSEGAVDENKLAVKLPILF